MPDKFNKYSRVKIVENNTARIIIHWRYAPKPSKVKLIDFVDEYFTIYPDGMLVRTFRKGVEKLDEWDNGNNLTVKYYMLESNGIQCLEKNKISGVDTY